MATADTIQRVPRPRGELSENRILELDLAAGDIERAKNRYRWVVLMALEEGSYSEVSKVTGLSTNTLQRWKREAGK